MKRLLVLTALVWLTQPSALADQVVLKNGDRLTGKILESDQKKLVIESEFAGTVNVQWDAVDQITSEGALHLTLKDTQRVVGSVRPADGGFQVETEQTGTVRVNKEAIETIRSPARQAAYLAEVERLRNPGLGDLWSGNADAGLSLSKGNSDTTSLAFAFNAVRKTTRDQIGVHATSIYAANSSTGSSETTANAVRGGVRYDLNLSDRSFVFALGDLEYDEFQDLDLRAVLGGGYGHRLVQRQDLFRRFRGRQFQP